MQDCNPDQIPAAQNELGTDKEGTEFSEQWSYSSAIGMLLYLAANASQKSPMYYINVLILHITPEHCMAML